MIKYLGSKRVLLPGILGAIRSLPGVRSVLDLFAGTSRVGMALKAADYQVIANDHNAYAAVLARCYVAADREDWLEDATCLVRELNALPGSAGYFTDTFCVCSRFFQPKNGERVDAIREAIAAKGLEPELEAVLLVSLMEAADRVDSTTGVQMAYLKEWAPRAFNDLELRVPDLLSRARSGKGAAFCLDASEAAGIAEVDVAYLDPPYNQHSYLGNYHVWESLVRWDKPVTYGVACKRVDCRERRSVFNSRRDFAAALRALLARLRARTVVVSFNNEGYMERSEMEAMLRQLHGGAALVVTLEQDYRRYVGAQIGIHNPRGERVGKVSHLRNKEYLYVVTPPGLDLGAPLASGWGEGARGPGEAPLSGQEGGA
ncbi:MAG: DNA adenine methylase [Polyangiaceae bacterium]|nr:DNA adenine methylase [Polyangiaceae bacterium]